MVPSGDPSRPGRARRGDRGSSLVEVLVSVVIVGTTGVGLLGSLLGVLDASATSQERSGVMAALSNAGERLASPTLPYVSCAVSNGVPSSYTSTVAGSENSSEIELSIVSIHTWDGTAFSPVCDGSGTDALQLVELRATGHGVADVVSVITKRNGIVLP